MFEYRLEHILFYAAKLGTRELIGNVPDGVRVNVHVIGGEVMGPRISGKFRTLSSDWLRAAILRHGPVPERTSERLRDAFRVIAGVKTA